VADDHNGVGRARERGNRRLHALLVVGGPIVQRKVGRDCLVASSFQRVGEQVPARSVVPLAVYEAERRDGAKPTLSAHEKNFGEPVDFALAPSTCR
jgi:hypothetical protein